MDTKTVIDKRRRNIELRTDDIFSQVEAFHGDVKIGEFYFRLQNEDHSEWLLVSTMYLDHITGYTRQGIGTQILKWVYDSTGLNIIFGEDRGYEGDDSSHLTGDGLPFSRALKSIMDGWK